ncbi:hypothetical protein IJ182_01260 [bacterium]|nr:hypothetical protein [bacterium]
MCNYYDAIKTAVQVAAFTLTKVQERKTQKRIEAYENRQIIETAKREEDKAGEEIQDAVESNREKRLQSILSMGKEKASYASGNLSLSSLTLSDIEDDEKQTSEFESLKTMNMAQRRAKNHLIQADKYYENMALRSFKSQQSFKTGMFTIAANTVSSAANTYLTDKKSK